MKLFDVIRNLYLKRDFNWLDELDSDEEEVPNLTLFNYLMSDEETAMDIRGLSKYVFDVPSKMFIALLHVTIPKRNETPNLTSNKKPEIVLTPFVKLMDKIKKHFRYSDREFSYVEPILTRHIKTSREDWFEKLGVSKEEIKTK